MENTNINTDGGTVVQGDADIGHDFVGRDKVENHLSIVLQPQFVGTVQEAEVLEILAVPALLKAIDFLFGEASKILAERRLRRDPETPSALEPEASGQLSSSMDNGEIPVIINSHHVALTQPITESAWSASESKIKHLTSLLDIHTKNYYLAKEQYAKWGSALVPPIVVHSLTEAEDSVAKTAKELQVALGDLYGKKVTTPEVEQAS